MLFRPLSHCTYSVVSLPTFFFLFFSLPTVFFLSSLFLPSSLSTSSLSLSLFFLLSLLTYPCLMAFLLYPSLSPLSFLLSPFSALSSLLSVNLTRFPLLSVSAIRFPTVSVSSLHYLLSLHDVLAVPLLTFPQALRDRLLFFLTLSPSQSVSFLAVSAIYAVIFATSLFLYLLVSVSHMCGSCLTFCFSVLSYSVQPRAQPSYSLARLLSCNLIEPCLT